MNNHTKSICKRLLIVFLCLVLTLGTTVTVMAASFRGDLNNDGNITAFDAQMLAEYQAGCRQLDPAAVIGLSVRGIIDRILGKPNILISSEEFLYGSYFDHDRFQGNTGTRLLTGDYIKIRSADALLPKQDITIRVTDTNLTDYKVTLGYYTADGIYTGRNGIVPMVNGELTIKASEMAGAYFRVNVYLYNGRFTKVPESAQILVYGEQSALPEQPTEPEQPTQPEVTAPTEPEVTEPTEPEASIPPTEPVQPEQPVAPEGNILIANEEFIYGSYFDNNKFGHNDRITSGAYGLIRSADVLLPAQDITIRVTAADLTNYNVTLGYFTKDGVYTGRNGIVPMVNGELTIKASELAGAYFRVNVYIYNGSFTKVPESAQIVVYGETSALPEQPVQPWEGKKISIVGDSISTGGYVGTLGNLTGAEIQNLSVSGTKLTGGITKNVTGVATDADLIIIFGGTNDYWHKSTNIGTADSTDVNTYVGALRYILNYLQTHNPDAEYLFVFPADQAFQGNASSTDFGRGTLDDFRAAFLTFCEENHVPYVNLKDTEFDAAKHSGDGVHPNSAGHQIIAEAIYNAITKHND